MNTYLTKLFDKYNISDRNRYEILQIFSLLPFDKKQNLLNNFGSLSIKINKIEEEINTEKEILLGQALGRIKKVILDRRNKKSLHIREKINILKKEI